MGGALISLEEQTVFDIQSLSIIILEVWHRSEAIVGGAENREL